MVSKMRIEFEPEFYIYWFVTWIVVLVAAVLH